MSWAGLGMTFLRSESGTAAVEYAMIAAVFGGTLVVASMGLKAALAGSIQAASTQTVASVSTGSTGGGSTGGGTTGGGTTGGGTTGGGADCQGNGKKKC